MFGESFGEVKKAELFVLADNFVPRPGKFIGEYGFSMFLKLKGDEEIGILLDTGAGYAIEHNWKEFNLDWDAVNFVVLSHRHFDHTGGLMRVLERINAPVLAHPDIFKPSFLWVRERLVDGSLPFSEQVVREKARLYLVRDAFKIAPGVALSGEVKRVTEFEKTPETFRLEDGRFIHDEMSDDMSLYIKTKKGLAVITGCAHSGVVNILRHAEELTGEKPYLVAGGFHLIFSGKERVNPTIEELRKLDVIAPCHCSGVAFAGEIAKLEPSKYLQLGAGVKFEI
jgi:7,8-dihydropterin-6-yl-methyl-4-(beta-D-ribofuranosyl)aminobenzene 5'-phosphate synthase